MSVHAPVRVPTGPPALRAPTPPARGSQPEARAPLQRLAQRDLTTYVVGNAVFWLLWAAISISADHWYWWAAVPLAAWTAVLALHLRHARERAG